MKKIGLLIFISALAVGLISTMTCSVSPVPFGGTTGSGNLKTEARNVSGFRKIECSNAINLEVAVGESHAVEVEADDNIIETVKTEINGDTLKIFNEGRISTKNKITVKVKMPELGGLDLSGASIAKVANVKSDSLDLDASGASRITIFGETKNLKAEASGASNINAESLLTENAEVDSSGASSVTVTPSNELKAESSGASSVVYTGEPKNVVQKTSGASSIKKK